MSTKHDGGSIMKNKFKIGEISKLFRMSVKTLRYYDEVGIFKPNYIDPENKYRYYSADQFELLTMVTYMRHLEMPIKDIKKTLDNMTVSNIIIFLESHQMKLDEKIKELQSLKGKIKFRIDHLKIGKSKIGREEFSIQEQPLQNIIKLPHLFSKKEDLELAVREFEIKLKKLNLFVLGKVGVILNKDRLDLRNFSEYDALYFLLDDLEMIDGFETLQGGTYASLYYRGSIEESKNYYPKILNYIDNMGYEPIGPAYERAIISNSVTNQKNEYVRKIEIPVKKLTF